MSESSKMGLFGSKDDNSGTEAAENDNNEVPKVKESSTEVREAPYNIDSDSETYDTEALSIMDINDIIGVQAESTNDSTLESEFAALSEIITDCKGEFSKIDEGIGAEEKAVGKSDRNRENNITEGASSDSARDDTSKNSQTDAKTSQDSGMASISKSLQLIGEAYISEDSQETDTEEIPESNTLKVTDLSDCLKASTSNIQDPESHKEKLSGEAVASSSDETPCITDLKEEITVQKTAEKPQEMIAEVPKSPQVEKSADSTDSAGVDKSLEKPNEGDKTESMDIDCSSPENAVEPAATKNQLESKIESSEDQKFIDESQTESTVVESVEPMEIDQVNEKILTNIETEKVDTVNAEKEIDNVEKSSELVTESTAVASKTVADESEKSKECIDEVSTNNETFAQFDDVKESVIPIIHQDSATEVLKFKDEEQEKTSARPESEKRDSEKLEMQTDDTRIEATVTEVTESGKSKTEIEEPTEAPSTIKNVVVEGSQEKVEKSQEAPDSAQKVRDVEKEEIPSLVQKVAEVELMEIDDHTASEQTEKESCDPAVSSSALSEYPTNNSEVLQPQITTEATLAEPESSENVSKEVITGPDESAPDTSSKNSLTAVEAVETESDANIASEEKANNESVSNLSGRPSAETLWPIPEETENEASLAPVIGSSDKSAPIVDSPQDEIIPDSTVNEFATRIPTEFVDEDEKMEVDAAAKKQEEEKSDIFEPVTESQESDASASTVLEVETTEEHSIISKAVESDILAEASLLVPSPVVTETMKIVEKCIEIPIESPSETSHEIKTPEVQADETASKVVEDDKVDGKAQEKELTIPEIKDEGPMKKSPDIEALENVAAESIDADLKPEAKEEENKVSETSNFIEAEEAVVDVPVEMKNEDRVVNEQESPIANEAEIHDTNPIEETVYDPTISEADIELKSTNDAAQETSTKEPESLEVFSKPEVPAEATIPKDTSSSIMNPDDVDEDPIEEEMNLSLDPEIGESQEEAIEKLQSHSLSLEQTNVDPEEEIEDNVEMNLSPNSEEKINEAAIILTDDVNKITTEDCVDESSMTSTGEKPDESEDRFEKPYDYIDENSKDIEPTTASVPDMFHDEQSQTTQEMMESILEGDSSNLNKILDAEEAEGEARARSNALEQTEIEELSDKLPSESEELLSKALDDPMSSQNIDSLEGLLDLDLIPESDEPTMKVTEPIAQKVLNESEEDIGIIGKDVDVSLLLEETEQAEGYSNEVPKITEEIAESKAIAEVVDIVAKSDLDDANDLPITPSQLSSVDDSELIDNDLDVAFDLASVVSNPLEAVPLAEEESKIDLAEDLLREIAVEEERKMGLAEQLFFESPVPDESNKIDLPTQILRSTGVQGPSKIVLPDESLIENSALLESVDEADKNPVLADPILPQATVAEDSKMELSEDISLVSEIEDLVPGSEISELESAVKFLQESEEQDIDSSMALSPKLVDSVVDDITQESDVGIFASEANICDDPSDLVPELEDIIPDPIAISEAEIISEAAKLESQKKTKEEAKLQSPIAKIVEKEEVQKQLEILETPSPLPTIQEPSENIPSHPGTPKTHREPRETIAKSPIPETIEHQLLKKSVPIPKTSILEERLKVPPKIEIPVGEISRICEMPTTPKTSLLIQRDAKMMNYQKMMDSPKSSDKGELKVVDTPRKDSEKHDFENVGSPRIILKIAKSALADCGEPRSPKSPKIRSATNSPNPEDSPGQKLSKIKLKLSKGGHPSIIPNDNVEEVCGQWHTEGTSSLSPLGMKIKFSKTGDASIVQAEKHETFEEQPKHKFEEAKRTESPIGMKIKLSRTGDPSIVQQDAKESTSKHKDKLEMMQDSPKRTESPIGMKIKLSKSGDASIIQPEKHESSEDHREGSRSKDKLDVHQDIPRRTESPLGMKIKLFKTGDASIVQTEAAEDSPQEIKRTDSPLGMKIKLSKTRGGASIIPVESSEEIKEKLEVPEMPRRTESPLGMKIKLSKRGDASIIHFEESKEVLKHKERIETNQESALEASPSVKIKVTKCGESSTVQPETSVDPDVRTSSIGMKFKLSKTGDASIVHSDSQEQSEDSRSKERIEKTDSSIGMKIKLSKTGDASIIPNVKKSEDSLALETIETDNKKLTETSLGMKIKLQKSGDASIMETDKKDKIIRRKDAELPLEMKIKLSKTGHPTIIGSENYGECSQRPKESTLETATHSHAHKHKESLSPKENPGMKMLKSMQSANAHGGRSELTIEPIHLQSRKTEVPSEASSKRKDVTISPLESKKAKLEAKLSQMLPEVTIQPIKPRDPKQMMFDSKASSISRQQMNVISQEISITQVRSNKPMDLSMTDKLKSILTKTTNTVAASDCEIIEHRPELIIVNENSNSSQEVMIIEEVPALRGPDAKIPKKRGRPRRNPLPLILAKPLAQGMMPTDPSLPRDPLALDDVSHMVGQIPPQNFAPKENERPKRTCSRQKSYAPPKRGRGRGGGRGKRKMEMSIDLGKKPRIEQDLDMIERSTTAVITIDEPSSQPDISHNTSELYKALRQPPMDSKMANAMARVEAEQAVNDADLMSKSRMESLMDSRLMTHLGGVMETSMKKSVPIESFDNERKMNLTSLCESEDQVHMVTDQMEKSESRIDDEKIMHKSADEVKEIKDTTRSTDHQNWLTPSSKKLLDGRNEGNISNVQVIDEETRMSAESGSRSQTPARNMSVQASETIVNEESQGSVLSTATTESEKVKVKNRRMEINFDPDEGPFTVDKIAEYEWPPDPTRKGETFMIQEQISHYLGVKSFKRKYPDLKRRMVDMEERNFLRENALVSEAMCDMGLTAVSSSEVLDVMCNDFPDQYEEYRKYIREKQMREHSKKQKELTAAANAERNRIDLAEMAVQSALSWNVGLNKARRESRKCSLDLQTFTIHVPKKQQKVEEESRVSHYPVALIPGQYTDYYREYTPAELRYYPLNTVLYGPMKPNERKFDSQSEGSQSDSDSDSSSDDSSSSSSDGTQDTEESQSTMDEVDVELSRQKEDIKSIKCKMCLKHLNKFSRTEVLIQCGTCNGYVHPSCIDLTLDMVPHIQAYAWQCTDCKTCAQCHDPADEDKMLFCDMCDRGYHIYCVGLRRVPQGRWHCQECAVCASCGSREAGGANSDRNSVAQWQHEYKKGDKNTRVYVSTLCVPCSKLWRKGRYCPHCSRCHTVPRLDLEANLVHCSACDKYLHLGCVETRDLTIDRKNYLCDFCQPSRQQMVKPLVSKVFRT